MIKFNCNQKEEKEVTKIYTARQYNSSDYVYLYEKGESSHTIKVDMDTCVTTIKWPAYKDSVSIGRGYIDRHAPKDTYLEVTREWGEKVQFIWRGEFEKEQDDIDKFNIEWNKKGLANWGYPRQEAREMSLIEQIDEMFNQMKQENTMVCDEIKSDIVDKDGRSDLQVLLDALEVELITTIKYDSEKKGNVLTKAIIKKPK